MTGARGFWIVIVVGMGHRFVLVLILVLVLPGVLALGHLSCPIARAEQGSTPLMSSVAPAEPTAMSSGVLEPIASGAAAGSETALGGTSSSLPQARDFATTTESGLRSDSAGPTRTPWRRRLRRNVPFNRMADARVSPSDWPPEPASPTTVDPDRLARALRKLCGWMPRGTAKKYARWSLEYAREFGEDPFMLGAMIHRLGRCRAEREELDGLGLTLIAPAMYRRGFRGRAYRYWVWHNGSWHERARRFERFSFNPWQLKRAEPNIYFAAGLLSVWREQATSLEISFEQTPHRHYVSHFFWGDRVKSSRPEDRVLTDRRRLLEYYGKPIPPPPLSRAGLLLGPPLDGAPRVVSSALGADRGGRRRHRGIDVESELGEPVRAIADGKVNFSGVGLKRRGSKLQLRPKRTNRYNRRRLGRSGRYVCIVHKGGSRGPLQSCYMHLESVRVVVGQKVRRGQAVGTVGRTGMQRSAPHLHLQINNDKRLIDGLELLRGHLIGRPQDDPRLPHVRREMRRRRRQARRHAAMAAAAQRADR
ncbi:MAG: M23 family metallopeptidase [Proteobacteria bacterium]|nr:M23 family metallopeptidase [Pseudomonadota bacterium]